MKETESLPDTEMTEFESGLDPMMLVQCYLEEDDIESSFPYISDEYDDKYESENYSDNSESYLKLHSCTMCPRRFPSEFNLLVHMWSHPTQNKRILSNKNQEEEENHSDELNADEETTSDMLDSNNIFGKTSDLIQYSCPVCGKSVSTKGNLKVHVETHRPKGKYACDICGRM